MHENKRPHLSHSNCLQCCEVKSFIFCIFEMIIGWMNNWWLVLWIYDKKNLYNYLWAAQKSSAIWTQYIRNWHNAVIHLKGMVRFFLRSWRSLSGTELCSKRLTLYRTHWTDKQSEGRVSRVSKEVPWAKVNRNEVLKPRALKKEKCQKRVKVKGKWHVRDSRRSYRARDES